MIYYKKAKNAGDAWCTQRCGEIKHVMSGASSNNKQEIEHCRFFNTLMVAAGSVAPGNSSKRVPAKVRRNVHQALLVCRFLRHGVSSSCLKLHNKSHLLRGDSDVARDKLERCEVVYQCLTLDRVLPGDQLRRCSA